MKLTTLIPTRRNDGSAVSKAEMAEIFQKFWSTFEGCTDEGKTNGVWVHEGTVYRDVCRKLVVNIDNARYAEAMMIIKDVGRQLGQLAMYVEVQYFDGIQIVPID